MRIGSYSSRFWLWAPLAALFGLGAALSLYWFVAADRLEKKLDAVNGHEAAPGIALSFAGRTVSGFPFNMDVVFSDFAISGQGAHGPFRWQSEKFALHRLTYGPFQDLYEAAGKQSLSWTDGAGRTHSLTFLPGALRASAVLDGRGLLRFDLDMVAAGGQDSGGEAFTANGVQFHLRRDPKADALDLMVSADDVTSQEDIARLFGRHIQSLSLYATLSQGSGFAPLLAGKESWAQAIADWRARGGQVTLGPVSVASSGVNLSASRFPDADGALSGLLDPLY